MKIAFYMDEGLEQIVLTPETETEKTLLFTLHTPGRELSIYQGTFYECRGGWMRHGLDNGMQSTMIVLRPRSPAEPSPTLRDLGITADIQDGTVSITPEQLVR